MHNIKAQHHAKGAETTLEDITSSWATGVPATIRFLGKSFHAVPKGPGGLILHDSPKSKPPAKIKTPIADFTHTVNMLSLISKAETKMKTQAALKTGTLNFVSINTKLVNNIISCHIHHFKMHTKILFWQIT